MKKGQISVEYLILVGFISFVVIGLLAIAFFYTASTRDQVKSNQLTNFGNKLVSSAETVFYEGEPSKVTISAYLPEGVTSFYITDNELVFIIETNSGTNTVAFQSDVSLKAVGSAGTCLVVACNEGLKKIVVKVIDDAGEYKVEITEASA